MPSLDPEDWTAFRALSHRMVDDMLARLEDLPGTPAWTPVPADILHALTTEPLPKQGQGEAAAYQDFFTRVLPYSNGNLHPRSFGWVHGNGTALGMMADMLASGLNPHMAGYHQAPRYVEERVIAWLAEIMGFPEGTSGLFETGGTMANVIGLAVARHAMAAYDLREEGVRPMRIYCSSEVHGWAQKAVELMGIGNRNLRRVPVDADYRIDLAQLETAIVADHAQGLNPVCVIGTAGTVNTGATDDLTALAQICRRHKLWFHVDGAFGALLRLSPTLRSQVAGIELADSLAFDLHKWVSQPIECAVVLVRDAALHRAAFALTPSYLAASTRGVIAGGLPFADRGIDLTRGFKALKAWLGFKAQGADRFARVIEQNVRDAQAFSQRIAATPGFELLAPTAMNIVAFRYAPARLPEPERNALNNELLLRIQESGVALPSGTVLQGRFAIRLANVNHRSRPEDFDLLYEALVREAHILASPSAPEGIEAASAEHPRLKSGCPPFSPCCLP